MRLPPGFRFHPTDVELILYYLKRKIMGKKLHYEAIAEVNLYKFAPWDLPDKSCLKSKDLEWFFFCPREKKYTTGKRVKRATENGYWKTTGKDRTISCNDETVGAVKTLIFHLGHAPHGERTDWVIYEYRILDNKMAEAGIQDSYVLCKVFKKNGLGPKNGAQYGAPFNEADWADDDDDQNHATSLVAEGPSQTLQMQNEEQIFPHGSGLFDSGSPPLSAVAATNMIAAEETGDEIERFLASFTDEDMMLQDEDGRNQDDLIENGKTKLLPSSEGLDIYNGLHDLDSWNLVNEGRCDFSGVQDIVDPMNMLPQDNSAYIELDDLLLPLDCSNGDAGTHLSSPCQASASYSHEIIQQLPARNRFAGMDQHTLFANELAVLPNTSESHKSFDVLQMMDHQIYQGDASYDLCYPSEQLESAVYSSHTMQRGSHLENRKSRFMECIPAHLPTAAAELLALSPCGGSSIHIKAEVTHGAGECTNEALAIMMEGSSSCWCNLDFWIIQLCAVEGLLYLVEFVSDFILVCYFDNVSRSSRNYHWNKFFIFSSQQNMVILLDIYMHAIISDFCDSGVC